MSTKTIIPRNNRITQDPLKAAFARLHRHSTFTYKLPARPPSVTDRIKAAILRGLVRR